MSNCCSHETSVQVTTSRGTLNWSRRDVRDAHENFKRIAHGKAHHHPKPSHLSTRSLAVLSNSSQTQASLLPKTAKPGIEISSRERRPTTSQGPKTSGHKRATRNPAGQAKCKHHPPKRTNERKNPGPNRGARHPNPTQKRRNETTKREDTRRCRSSEPEGFKTVWTPKGPCPLLPERPF